MSIHAFFDAINWCQNSLHIITNITNVNAKRKSAFASTQGIGCCNPNWRPKNCKKKRPSNLQWFLLKTLFIRHATVNSDTSSILSSVFIQTAFTTAFCGRWLFHPAVVKESAAASYSLHFTVASCTAPVPGSAAQWHINVPFSGAEHRESVPSFWSPWQKTNGFQQHIYFSPSLFFLLFF